MRTRRGTLSTSLQNYGEIVEVGNKANLKPLLSDWKGGETHERVIAGVEHHLILKMPDMLDEVTHSGVIVESQS